MGTAVLKTFSEVDITCNFIIHTSALVYIMLNSLVAYFGIKSRGLSEQEPLCSQLPESSSQQQGIGVEEGQGDL